MRAIWLVLLILASPVLAREPICDLDFIPADKRAAPTVQYHVIKLPQSNMQEMCGMWQPPGGVLYGCAVPETEDLWYLFIDNTLSGEDLHCVIEHEKAHMPPNLWVHPSGLTMHAR